MTHPIDFNPDDQHARRHINEDGSRPFYDDEIAHDFFMRHQNRIDEQDRREEKAGRNWGHLAYRDRPAPRERREHFDENRVRALTHPRTGQVNVQPRECPIDEAA